jgi:hypothetical protein
LTEITATASAAGRRLGAAAGVGRVCGTGRCRICGQTGQREEPRRSRRPHTCATLLAHPSWLGSATAWPRTASYTCGGHAASRWTSARRPSIAAERCPVRGAAPPRSSRPPAEARPATVRQRDHPRRPRTGRWPRPRSRYGHHPHGRSADHYILVGGKGLCSGRPTEAGRAHCEHATPHPCLGNISAQPRRVTRHRRHARSARRGTQVLDRGSVHSTPSHVSGRTPGGAASPGESARAGHACHG